MYILNSFRFGNADDDIDVDAWASLTNKPDVSGEVAFYHDMIYKPTEKIVSIQIKSLGEKGNAEEAEKVLWQLKSTSSPLPTQEQVEEKRE